MRILISARSHSICHLYHMPFLNAEAEGAEYYLYYIYTSELLVNWWRAVERISGEEGT
jgi:hypothetical protein